MIRKSAGVNMSRRHSKFGENLHYLTEENLQRLWDTIDSYEHKLMLRLIHELGCRVGEFVRVRLRHINFRENSIFFSAENTKTKERRTSYVPQGLMNELKEYLKREGMMTKREEIIKDPDAFLLPSRKIAYSKIGTGRGTYRFRKEDLDAYLEDNRVEPR